MSKQDKNDSTIKKLTALVNKKREELGARPRLSLKTHGLFKFDGERSFSLNVINKEIEIIEALAFLLNKQSSMEEAGEMLGLSKSSEMEWGGYVVSDWLEDFRGRVGIIVWMKNKKKLDTLQMKLDKLISEEAKAELELDEIKKMLED